MQKTKQNQNVEEGKEFDKIILKSPWKNKQEVNSPENTQESQEPLIRYLPPPSPSTEDALRFCLENCMMLF